MSFTLRKGSHYEDNARKFLRKQGLQLIESNFRCRLGEIDLIMQHDDCVCFVEVRFRKSGDYGGAGASITVAKQRKIIRAARFYLAQNAALANRPLRFDALLIEPGPDGRPDYNWIQNAFYAE